MGWWKFLVPHVPKRALGGTLLLSIAGGLTAGVYGIVHDQITYTISEEYFTRFKFDQFDYARPGSGEPRVFAGRVGFLASWWVGIVVGWVLSRLAYRPGDAKAWVKRSLLAFLIVYLMSACSAAAGWGWGLWRRQTGYSEGWLVWMAELGVENRADFMTVGYIHNASYIGGVVGTILAIVWMRVRRRLVKRLA